ncbi:MAG: glycerophosphodiester phosphodiesterase family protein [Lachnospiraceae bacterium]|nr:glycerophosphodiester phosphodiesterase family protein [Lachnospiraceae bacterium]
MKDEEIELRYFYRFILLFIIGSCLLFLPVRAEAAAISKTMQTTADSKRLTAPVTVSNTASVQKKWYQTARTIMHAAGGIGKTDYTNSKEALKTNLKRGKRLIEIDFRFTTDGTLVCNHDWNNNKGKPLSLASFLGTKTSGGYTPQTAEEAVKTIAAFKNAYLVADSKESDIAKVYQELVDICKRTGNTSFLNRIVVQLYYKSDYTKVKKIYAFKNWNFTLYRLKPSKDKEYKDIASFCKKNGIQTITMRYNWVTNARMKILKKYGITGLAYTVNSKSTYKKLRKLGITAIFTDFL